MDAIVHIGLPKTGTTSIQAWLQQNQTWLAEKGLIYDRLGLPDRSLRAAHFEVEICQFNMLGEVLPVSQTMRNLDVHTLSDQAEYAKAYETHFADWLETHQPKTVILSNEGFAFRSNSSERIQALDTWLKQYFENVRYICYLRRQEDHVASQYVHFLMNRRRVPPLNQFIEQHGKTTHAAQLNLWQTEIGANNLDVRLMESAEMVDGDLYADFCDALGLKADGDVRPDRQRVALSAPSLILVRAISEQLQERRQGMDGSTFMNQVVKFLRKHDLPGPKFRLSPAQITQVRQLCAEDSEALRQAFFPHKDALFPERSDTQEPEPVRAEDVARLAAKTVVALQKAKRK